MIPFALVASLIASVTPTADDRPNLVVILADDLGPGDVSGFGGRVATPNLDRMAREGVRFNRYVTAAPICSPSRCGLITGQFPARWRITSYLQTRAGNAACGQADFLDPAAPSLPRALKAAGYRTAHVGKWHLGGGRDVHTPPKFADYGYDLGLGTWESPEPHPDLTAKDWVWSIDDKVKRWDRTGWMVDRTLEFLDAGETPCFVNLWLDDPHTPWVPSAADQQVGPKGQSAGRGDTPERLADVMVTLDRQVGRLLESLRARTTKRPALVVFLSDNGPLPTFAGARTVGRRGSKLSLYEGGLNVPLIVWGPGIVPAGITDDATVLAAVDLFPTLCRIGRADLPPGSVPDGEDLSPAFLGRAARRSKMLFWEYGRNPTSFAYPKGRDRSPNLAVRDGDWKLLIHANGTGAELYDLATDPGEKTNRIQEQPDVVRRLTAAVLEWRNSLP